MEVEAGIPPRAFYPDYVNEAPRPARTPGWNLETERQLTDGRTLARALGWFSIGLGILELVAPRRITEFLGVDDRHATLVRYFGMREIGSGVAILAQRDPVAGVWSRVAGDMVDLAALGGALRDEDAHPGRVLGAMAVVAGVTALDAKCAQQLHKTVNSPRRA